VTVTEPPPLATRLIGRLHAQLGEVQEIGTFAGGRRRVVPIAGGRFEGADLRAEIVPGGADWQIVTSDGAASIEARYTLRTDDGALILVHSRGVRTGPADVLARLAAGEQVDPSEYYFRTLVTLESGAPRYGWVNGRLFIAAAARLPDQVVFDLHEIL
jgi:Protein of unknown function (DUF3237)